MAKSLLCLLQEVQALATQQLRTGPWTVQRFLNFAESSATLLFFGPEQQPDRDAPAGIFKLRISGESSTAVIHGWISIPGAPDSPCGFDLAAHPSPEDPLRRICTKLASDLERSLPSSLPSPADKLDS